MAALMDHTTDTADAAGLARPWARWPILGVWVDDLSMDDLLDQLDQHGGVVFTLNPDHAYHLNCNRAFLDAYRSADLITMDSHYLLGGLRLRGMAVGHRLPGSDIVPAFVRKHAEAGSARVFLLGALPGVAQLAAERINDSVSWPMVVGAHGPSMNFVDDPAEIDAVIEMINASRATALFVGLGAPKQEIWIARHRHRMPQVRIFMGIGATIDYEAGTVRRAPKWLRSIGMEWFYRVSTEPQRYLMRYLRNTRVFWWLVLEHFGKYRPDCETKPTPGST